MKIKPVTYVLILSVVIVWGVILYQVLIRIKAKNNETGNIVVNHPRPQLNEFNIPVDTAKLLLNYRDPFGLTPERDTLIKEKKVISVKSLITKSKQLFNWSFISYTGYIRNPSSKKLIALVNINGKSTTLNEGQSKERVKLLKNLKDSIKVSYEGNVKFIAIKNIAL